MTEWRDIPGYEGLYQASGDGRIRSIGMRISSRVLKTQVHRDGYLCVGLRNNLGRKTCKVHRLVASAHLTNPLGLPCVDHINGDRADNRVVNLRWASHASNSLNRVTAVGEVGVVGVARCASRRNPFRAYICINGVKRYLGVFPTAQAASDAHRNAKEAAHG